MFLFSTLNRVRAEVAMKLKPLPAKTSRIQSDVKAAPSIQDRPRIGKVVLSQGKAVKAEPRKAVKAAPTCTPLVVSQSAEADGSQPIYDDKANGNPDEAATR